MKPIGKKGLELIKKWEGCRLLAYQDTAGVWTIGYGHTAGVYSGMSITQKQAEEYLRADCQIFANCVDGEYYCPFTAQLNANQRDALISFAYNCGAGSLAKLCRGRTINDVPKHILAYCNDIKGHKLQGLLNRRKEELALFNTPVEEEEMVYYEKLEDVPEYAKPTIEKLISCGSLIGKESGLHLSEDMIRIFVVNDRLGLYK